MCRRNSLLAHSKKIPLAKTSGNNKRETYQQKITVSAFQLVSSYAAAVNTNQPFKLASNCSQLFRHSITCKQEDVRQVGEKEWFQMPWQDSHIHALQVSQPAISSNAASLTDPPDVHLALQRKEIIQGCSYTSGFYSFLLPFLDWFKNETNNILVYSSRSQSLHTQAV